MKQFHKPKTQFDYNNNIVSGEYCIPLQAVPIAVGLIYQRSLKGSWADNQHIDGRDMLARAIMSIYDSVLCENTRIQAATYRLLASGIYGTQFTPALGNYSDIPDSPNREGFTGVALAPIQDSAYVVLTQIRDALQNGQGQMLDDDILAKLAEIAVLLA